MSSQATGSAMPHSPLMYGLIKLHAEIEGGMIGKRDRVQDRTYTDKLAHVRAVIRIIDPGFDVRRIKPKKSYKPNPWFKRGEMFLCAVGVLRKAEKPLSQTEIVRRMMAERGVSNPSPADLRALRNSIHATLPKYEGKLLFSTGQRSSRRWGLKGSD